MRQAPLEVKLSGTEALCNSSGSECALVLQSGGVAHALSTANVYWQSVTTDNERDAFRHAAWNAAMTVRIGYSKAQLWGNAHEYGSPSRNPGNIGEQMDFYNNSVGRNIGGEVSSVPAPYRDEYIASNVKAGIKSGRLRIVARLYPTETQASGRALVMSNSYSSQWPFGW